MLQLIHGVSNPDSVKPTMQLFERIAALFTLGARCTLGSTFALPLGDLTSFLFRLLLGLCFRTTCNLLFSLVPCCLLGLLLNRLFTFFLGLLLHLLCSCLLRVLLGLLHAGLRLLLLILLLRLLLFLLLNLLFSLIFLLLLILLLSLLLNLFLCFFLILLLSLLLILLLSLLLFLAFLAFFCLRFLYAARAATNDSSTAVLLCSTGWAHNSRTLSVRLDEGQAEALGRGLIFGQTLSRQAAANRAEEGQHMEQIHSKNSLRGCAQ
mmetsp:Transcript_89705/g.158765  ORF Transcript_89705/g.158765 Transcript_89705/m.158765 type:complete len:265 (+) Transcript_89705:1085-1879(+)